MNKKKLFAVAMAVAMAGTSLTPAFTSNAE